MISAGPSVSGQLQFPEHWPQAKQEQEEAAAENSREQAQPLPSLLLDLSTVPPVASAAHPWVVCDHADQRFACDSRC